MDSSLLSNKPSKFCRQISVCTEGLKNQLSLQA